MINETLVKHTFPDGLYLVPGRVLVLIPKSWELVSDAEQQLLARILGSVKLSLAAIQIVCATSFSPDDAAVYRAQAVLCFGVPFEGVTRPYEAASVDSITVILADPLDALDDTRKKNLWGALKQAFKV